jgi:hypothetical protein
MCSKALDERLGFDHKTFTKDDLIAVGLDGQGSLKVADETAYKWAECVNWRKPNVNTKQKYNGVRSVNRFRSGTHVSKVVNPSGPCYAKRQEVNPERRLVKMGR